MSVWQASALRSIFSQSDRSNVSSLRFTCLYFLAIFINPFFCLFALCSPSNEGFRFRATGSLNSDFAWVSQKRYTDFFGVRKNLCLLSDSCEIRVKMKFFKQLYRYPIGLPFDCCIWLFLLSDHWKHLLNYHSACMGCCWLCFFAAYAAEIKLPSNSKDSLSRFYKWFWESCNNYLRIH